MGAVTASGALLVTSLISLSTSACIPDVPQKLLFNPIVLNHPAIALAFQAIETSLDDLFINTTQDGLSFAIVHASTPKSVFTYNHGILKMNETLSYGDENEVTSDSIFRINSVSKSFAAFSALVIENLAKAKAGNATVEFTLDTPVRLVLPQFRLPEKDWNDGGRDITLRMLSSHTSGLTREGYSTDFNMVAATGKADAETIGAKWAGATPESVLERAAKTNLMFAPGTRAGC
ncbi:hypothetical protein N0V90_010465 [Kalmusia sp. IMI 367209]|nr:hypothetical protein N0V90_010465 [Kalmusia sp. IMI 367209]